MSLLIQFKETPLKRGAWSVDEDNKLVDYIKGNGILNWNEIPQAAGLARTGKSCRLRWMNYLRPNLKHGNFTKEEDDIILKLHKKHGNRWATIVAKLPGRSDNEIKNHFNTRLRKIAERRQVRSLHRTSSRQASSPVAIDQNHSVSEQNLSTAATSLNPSPTPCTNYSSSSDTNNLISFGNDHHEIIRSEALEEEHAGDHIGVDQLQLSVERMCMQENNENYIDEMITNYEGYGLEEYCFNVQGGDNVFFFFLDPILILFYYKICLSQGLNLGPPPTQHLPIPLGYKATGGRG